MTLIFRQLREAELALGEGDAERAAATASRRPSRSCASRASRSGTGCLERCAASCTAARATSKARAAAVAQALDELEICTDDVMRIARVTAVGLSVEADRAQRARDLGETADARDALTRARIHMQRLRAAAQSGGPVERAWREVGAAELAARPRTRRPGAVGQGSGRLAGAGAPVSGGGRAAARGRGAGGRRGERAAAAAAAARSRSRAGSEPAGWRRDPRTDDRARLTVSARSDAGRRPGRRFASAGGRSRRGGAPEDPFGLTARERQVLALVAQGATNRQIGAALYMAEKTASVHVSRILAKLGVRSRTQAAAVAHRQHLS